MTKEKFLKLQIGMYITDKNLPVEQLVCSDFYVITGFNKNRVCYQPLWSDGNVNSNKLAFSEPFDNIDLTHALHASDFREKVAIG